ncbi:hypothetical protein BEN47_12165 [Hymenobacter lapidarius]|uniref:DUF2784 domain-containing protein n=1 Tax=Hymenobacter lapidarius TaxID=1908237 RepID=A0A1G1T773_9BACT|nr:hypothetical protein [Hymenobacter lapidarius]OGX86735.1 hypothetical protein BEN47_12165 [Hymenobacter lapidarius]
MTAKGKLLLIRLAHTLVWAFFVAAIGYVVYSGLADKITAHTWVASGLVLAEGVLLLLFNRRCPLTILARKYSHSYRANFDIFLPEWLARHNQVVFTSIYMAGLVLLAYQLVQQP